MEKRGKIYLIESNSRQDLATMFMRFQEHYESPQFQGKTFTVDEFAHWYASKYGSFSYAKDWYGFNIPATVLAPFKQGNFDPLTVLEQKLIEICKGASDRSYIIGVTPSAEYFKETVKHEFVHGAFYTNPEYRREVEVCIQSYKIKPISKGLRRMGYCDDVAVDETNAYVLVEPDLTQEHVSIQNTKKLRGYLGKIFERHFGFSLINADISSLTARTEHMLV
ncbi:MAG: ABC transporter ATP-binding protein [Patescibacteria group bacterium]